ncbi:pescadillo isoform X1 [Brevipalpus obovatus]|uniref:pescadillo isoform X1 n=1 Tax=Brevipalpus obovatus TaxID=246614 RepID=UPI003D9DF151
MTQPKRKGQTGAKRAFITRRKAMQKLQLSLKDFRRLCIIKGIYPVEPRKRKRGMSRSKTYYLLDDIRFLASEPIIWKFWEYKTFLKKVTRASHRKEDLLVQNLKDNPPIYRMDHIVKERYPSFTDALKDLDDSLCMCFLYANFAKNRGVPQELTDLCRRLTLEFMHYIIATKSLRKVFISIKGYYYQADVMGITITWIVPHQFVLNTQKDVDMRVMRTFTEFYVTLMGFINFKLFSSINLYYPPKVASLNPEEKKSLKGDNEISIQYEYIAALNRPILHQIKEKEDIETMPDDFKEGEDDESGAEERKLTFHQLRQLENLFKGLKFFLSREVPRESLVFVIKCFGGEASWDKMCFVGATFDETDPSITHQIVDRKAIPQKYMNRYYIQPQWIYDCVNAQTLLPVERYFHDVTLPPHLSPFVQPTELDYDPMKKLPTGNLEFGERKAEESDHEDVSEDEELPEKRERVVSESKDLKMQVKEGKHEKVDLVRKKDMEKAEEKRLAVMMIPKKKKRLYDKMMYGKRRKTREADKLKAKREKYENNLKSKKNQQSSFGQNIKKGVKRKR